ncbi:hypothetical protein [Pandoravirus japonicus]|uniref:Uncharacterized protein n=1 Tax=Pandoravirus japonicus TaxID=2823154 RepID=A0A811BPF8_9VIRU|nr:hypothetical protein [Pandoravirus japonicus]
MSLGRGQAPTLLADDLGGGRSERAWSDEPMGNQESASVESVSGRLVPSSPNLVIASGRAPWVRGPRKTDKRRPPICLR